jgi:hypothetical protein
VRGESALDYTIASKDRKAESRRARGALRPDGLGEQVWVRSFPAMGLRGIAIVLGLILCGLAVYFLSTAGETGSGDHSRPPVRSLERRAHELDSIEGLPAPIAPLRTRPYVDLDAPESRLGAAQMIDVSVLVLSRRSQAPQADVAVELAAWPPLEGVPPARGVTNAFGSATLTLEKRAGPEGDQCSVTVGPAERSQVFRQLPLTSRLVVLIDDCTRLHGRVGFRGIDPEARPFVQLNEPPRGAMTSVVMIGTTQADRSGAFELHACPTREIPWVEVRVLLGSIAVVRLLRWEELSSEGGARIDVVFTDLLVRVLDEHAAPVVGAAVRIAYVGDGSGRFPAVGTTDERGEYRPTIEPGEVEVIAGREGYVSASERVQLPSGAAGSQVTLRLRRLDENDRLRGRVVREDGSAIENALVTAAPALESGDAAMAAFVQQRSAANGRFELAIAAGRELQVTAFRKDLGISDALRFFADGREVELVIRAQGALEVRVAAPPGSPGFARGRVEYVLVERRFDRSHHGHDFGVPFQIDEVPAGDYNVFVFVEGFNAYAEGSVRVAPETTTVLNLASRGAQFARGTVTGALLGGKLVLDHPTWSSEVERVWSATLDDRGRFELLLGEITNCPALLSIPGAGSRRVDLRAGDGNVIF